MVFFPMNSPKPIEDKVEKNKTIGLSSAGEELARVTWLTLVVYLEFLISVTIFIFTLIGVAIGWPVSALFLLALLQLAITIPGCIYNTQQMPLFLLTYIAFQTVTGLSELIWFIVHLVNGGSWPSALALGFLFLIQMSSVLIAVCCREKTIIRRKKSDLETHLSHPLGTTTSSSENETKRKEFQQSELSNNFSKRSSKRSSSSKSARSKRSQISLNDSKGSTKRSSIRTKSTQPSDSILTSTSKAGKKRIQEVKKMIEDMDAKEKGKSFESSKTASTSEALPSSK